MSSFLSRFSACVCLWSSCVQVERLIVYDKPITDTTGYHLPYISMVSVSILPLNLPYSLTSSPIFRLTAVCFISVDTHSISTFLLMSAFGCFNLCFSLRASTLNFASSTSLLFSLMLLLALLHEEPDIDGVPLIRTLFIFQFFAATSTWNLISPLFS